MGDKQKIEKIANKCNINISPFEIINEQDTQRACEKAVFLVKEGKASSLMKGLVETSTVMRAVLNKDKGIRDGKKLSHLAAFEVSLYHKLLFVTDAAVNILPDVNTKKDIIVNAATALNKLGIKNPNIALLAAKEEVDEKMPVTVEYAKLLDIYNSGAITNCIIDGPFALDNAVSKDAAKIKGIKSLVAGNADILLCPSIEAGNILYKSLTILAGAKAGSVVLGAKRPIVLTSRSDSAESKLVSIALSILF